MGQEKEILIGICFMACFLVVALIVYTSKEMPDNDNNLDDNDTSIDNNDRPVD